MTKHSAIAATRYDPGTVFLHWFTALLVLFQFLSAEVWGYFPRAERHVLIVSHMSLGFLLTAVLLIRIPWRAVFGSSISPGSDLLDRAARALHVLLYGLLALQMPLGFFTRWTGNQKLDVFGVSIASPLGPCSRTAGYVVDQIHDINAWIIMGLAGIHAMAALFHHFIYRDQVLQRMLPRRRS